jgi:hypothetical protein
MLMHLLSGFGSTYRQKEVYPYTYQSRQEEAASLRSIRHDLEQPRVHGGCLLVRLLFMPEREILQYLRSDVLQ